MVRFFRGPTFILVFGPGGAFGLAVYSAWKLWLLLGFSLGCFRGVINHLHHFIFYGP